MKNLIIIFLLLITGYCFSQNEQWDNNNYRYDIHVNPPKRITGRVANSIPLNVIPEKQSFTRYTDESRLSNLVKLSDGSYRKRYDTYMVGVDNEDRQQNLRNNRFGNILAIVIAIVIIYGLITLIIKYFFPKKNIKNKEHQTRMNKNLPPSVLSYVSEGHKVGVVSLLSYLVNADPNKPNKHIQRNLYQEYVNSLEFDISIVSEYINSQNIQEKSAQMIKSLSTLKESDKEYICFLCNDLLNCNGKITLFEVNVLIAMLNLMGIKEEEFIANMEKITAITEFFSKPYKTN